MRTGRRRKLIAAFFLFIFSLQLLWPATSFALTSGPTQPEMQKFEPAGASDLVNAFTGDMNYNLSLVDVGGFPVNLSYQSGTGMDEEASWVGTGWTLNPGTVNRTMRGLPDDFDGGKGDKITKQYSRKEFKKVGGQLVLKPSALAWEFGSASLKVNVYKDNYYGIGASVGAGIGFSLAKNTKSPLTAGLSLDVNSDVRSGVDISPNLSISANYDVNKDVNVSGSLSGGFSYNTRAGLKNVSLSSSFSTTEQYKNSNITKFSFTTDGSAVHYFGQSYTPSIQANTSNSGFTFSFDLGASIFGGYAGVGGSGYVYKEKNLEPNVSVPAYGYMNYAKGRKNEGALLDFNREKDGVFLTSAPAIPVPVATNDFFTATSQTGSQQFRPWFGGNYVVFDRIHKNTNNNTSFGLTIGGGNIFKGGGRVDLTNGATTTKKWTTNNLYLNAAEAPVNNSIDAEPVYFKQVGEKTITDNAFYNKFANTTTGKVTLSGNKTFASLKTRAGGAPVTLPAIVKADRERRNYGLSYLTNEQAKHYALNKKIGGIERDADPYRLPHHMAAMTVTDKEGKRMEYDIAVYNTKQEEVTFSVAPPTTAPLVEKARRTGIISYNAGDATPTNPNGRDRLYTKETTPGYATSFLLTGILSPDYVDLRGDGISDDDPGSAVKFTYKRHTANYKWRAPYDPRTPAQATDNKYLANYNEGFLSDPKDDKANYVYGEKEIWYLDTILSKTMVAVFSTSPREDALGVTGVTGLKDENLKLRKLDSIRLFSKADWVKNPATATPIKVVHFEYDYSLYPGVHNNSGLTVMGPDPENPSVNINLNAAKGKLTLRKVYFTFGKSSRGKSNPYQFYYDMRLINDGTISGLPSINLPDEEVNDVYLERQTDRWGSYKKSFYNRVLNNQRVFNNSEFSYSLQQNASTPYSEKQLADRFASKWQLNKIITPSSGIITIDYEGDDYAYVQNRKAMQMCFIKGIDVIPGGSNPVVEGLINKNKSGVKKLVIDLPRPVANTAEFQKLYMTAADGRLETKIFYKVLTDLNKQDKWEYVHGYAEINWAETTASGNTAYIAINKNGEYNPVVKAAWQMLRTDLPQFAYDGYDNSDAENFAEDAVAAIRSIVAAIGALGEITRPFEEKADKKNFANKVNITKSMVRLNVPPDANNITAKLGGGSRVKKVQITDEWSVMSNVPGSKTAKYGQVYDYTIKNKDGSYISSGVASYEPSIGNEENPFHEPINFTEKVHWSSDRHHFIEKPFCESYFPAASVGYSRVTVTAFGDDYNGGTATPHTGHIENEFYTAKDFPTIVDNLTLDQYNYENSLILKLFTSTAINKVATSQGFKVELNDMHGKPKSVKIFNKGGDLVSSSEYFYRVKDQDAELKELDNDNVSVLNYDAGAGDGTITQGTMATEIEFTSDVRESTSESTGTSVGGYTGGMLIPIPPIFGPWYIPYGAVNFNTSRTFDSYNSVSAVKVINRFGIISKVITTQNGSTIEAENLLWDAFTGEVLLTRTQTEYDKSTYAFSYPAYLVSDYEGMGGAYKNLGITFTNFATNANGAITSLSPANQAKYLFPGDELVNLGATKQKGWIIRSSDDTYRLIDETGDFITTNASWLLLRSGRRNMLSVGVGSVVMMKDPRVGGKILLDVDRKILNSTSVQFKDEWPVPVAPRMADYQDCTGASDRVAAQPAITQEKSYYFKTTPTGVVRVETTTPESSAKLMSAPGPGESCACSCLKSFFDYLINTNQLFILQSQNITVGQLVANANIAGYNIDVEDCEILANNVNRQFYALTSSPTATIYTAKIGDCEVSIRSNSANPVSFYSLVSQPCSGSPTVNYSGSGSQPVTVSYPVDCSIVTGQWNGSTTTTINSTKIVAAEYQDLAVPYANWFVYSTNFRIPGIALIPTNATITSAQLYLYAHPDGFNAPLYPNAHTTSTETNGLPVAYFARTMDINAVCTNTFYNGWHGGDYLSGINNHFQDVVMNLTSSVTIMVSQGKVWMGMNPNMTHNSQKNYVTFCSQTHPNVSKRPRLEVTYTTSASQPNIATLSIDECNSCPDPVGRTINPYYTGVLGNWRPLMNYVYTVNREQKPGNPNQLGGTDIRNSGNYKIYNAFWSFGGNNRLAETGTSDARWASNNQSVYFDQKGNEIESVDALGRYGSALFGYSQSVATAVSANARNNEIAFDGYEDYDFDLHGTSLPCPLSRHLDFGLAKQGGVWTGPGGSISTEKSHTGRTSYKLNGTTSITKAAGSAFPPGSPLSYDGGGRYLLNHNELAKGFAPIEGKKYLFSCWVYDNSPFTNTLSGVTITVNGQTSSAVTVVEGWKRIEIPFTASSNFNLVITGTNKYIDDVRILPSDGQMNSYVYDNQSMRLMAQLDENNFATLFEYDEEGTPVRVKKETEKGVLTLKENRQSMRQRN